MSLPTDVRLDVTNHQIASFGCRFPRIEATLTVWTEIPAAILVVAEVFVLLAGVIARYVVHRPLIWSDELASMLFIWLSMLGAVVALRRGEHMRLATLPMMLSPYWRSWLETLGMIIISLFLIALLPSIGEYIQDQWYVLTPAMRIHDSFRVVAIAVGVLLMLFICFLRLVESATLLQLLTTMMIVAIICGGFWISVPVLRVIGNFNLLIFFVVLVAVCVASGVPIAFSFGAATLAYLTFSTNAPLTIIVSRMDEGMTELILLSIPMFVVLGLLTEMMGLAKALIGFMASVLGHIRGGLSYVLIGAMFLVSGISGSKAADMAAVAPVLFPEMKRRGSKPPELIALLCGTAAMSETIPPSLVLITLGSVTGVSIQALFTGGIMPALLCTAFITGTIYVRSRGEVSTGERAPLTTIVRAFMYALPALALPFLIRTSVIEGVTTATEVSTIGVIYAVTVGYFFYGRVDWRRVYPMLVSTASLTGAVMLIFGLATAMAWSLTQSGFSQTLVEVMTRVPGGKLGFLAISIVAFAVLGSVLEGIPALVLFGPLLFPAARVIGIHEVHYAMVVILAMGLGLFAPPFGLGFYTACAVGGVSPESAARPVWPYLGVLLVAVIICALWPNLSIGLL
jgi:tripartite ATP-independent transporter DctM subunit